MSVLRWLLTRWRRRHYRYAGVRVVKVMGPVHCMHFIPLLECEDERCRRMVRMVVGYE